MGLYIPLYHLVKVVLGCTILNSEAQSSQDGKICRDQYFHAKVKTSPAEAAIALHHWQHCSTGSASQLYSGSGLIGIYELGMLASACALVIPSLACSVLVTGGLAFGPSLGCVAWSSHRSLVFWAHSDSEGASSQ